MNSPKRCTHSAGDEEAEQWALRAQELGGSDDLATQMFALGVRARESARNGDIGAALELASQAESLAATSEDPRDPGDAALNLAEITYLAGDSQRAEEMTQRAIDCYLSKGATVFARRARRLAPGWAFPHSAAGSEVTTCSQEPAQPGLSTDAPVTRPRSHDDHHE